MAIKTYTLKTCVYVIQLSGKLKLNIRKMSNFDLGTKSGNKKYFCTRYYDDTMIYMTLLSNSIMYIIYNKHPLFLKPYFYKKTVIWEPYLETFS